MGLFRKQVDPTASAAFVALATDHLGPAELKRQLLAEVVGDLSWELDLDTGTAVFSGALGDETMRAPVQVLGSWRKDGTWVWAWADGGRDLPPQLLRAADRVRSQVGGQDLAMFVQPEVAVDETQATTLSLVASGLAGGFPVYRGVHDGGAVYFMVGQVPLPAATLDDAVAAVRDAVAASPVDHRACVEKTLDSVKVPHHADSFGGIVFGHRDERRASFDAAGRLAGVASTMGG